MSIIAVIRKDADLEEVASRLEANGFRITNKFKISKILVGYHDDIETVSRIEGVIKTCRTYRDEPQKVSRG